MSLRDIAAQFCAEIIDIQPLGNGFINDTFRVDTGAASFVLQKINQQVFPEPEKIMENLTRLACHVDQLTESQHLLKIPKLLPTNAQKNYLLDGEGQFWRAWEYISDTVSLEIITHTKQAEQVGLALGGFHRLTQDLDAATLHDTLPGFHIAPQYLQHYLQVKSSTVTPENEECAGFIDRHQHIINDLEVAKAQGLLKVRTIHGDPKLNNFLFDNSCGQIVSIVDLDTVKPGLIHYDIGDCLRSCCHLKENHEFNLEYCQTVLTYYLKATGSFLSENDYHYIYPAIRLIPFELGIRFYTDYLEGNHYFKVTEPQQNLERALEQFRLCASILNQEKDIKNIIKCLSLF